MELNYYKECKNIANSDNGYMCSKDIRTRFMFYYQVNWNDARSYQIVNETQKSELFTKWRFLSKILIKCTPQHTREGGISFLLAIYI